MQLTFHRSADVLNAASILRWLWLMLLLASAASFAAEVGPVGEVTFLQGVATAQRPGETPRFLQKGEALNEGDVITTGGQGFALISLKDGTKMTLRPNTSFTIEKFRHNAGEESASFRLLKGGVRALTGLISKRNSNGMDINTVTATIGIRGTSFDARLCEADCSEEERRAGGKGRAVKPENIVARVAVLAGSATATGPDAQTRTLTVGAALFTGDSVRTAKGSHAVLAFRDQTKVTVVADSEFKLEDVRFTGAKSEDGNFAVRIVRGGVRALTGLLAKSNPKAVNFGITTAVIGLRGTGLDAVIAENCATPQDCAEGAFVSMWQDAVDLRANDRTLAVNAGQSAVYVAARNLLTLLDSTPLFIVNEPAPRPDQVDVDFNALFASIDPDSIGVGLYVGMRNGDIEFRGPNGSLYLGADEAGVLLQGQGVPVRLTRFPSFMLNDPTPTPEGFDERSFRLLELLNPGDLICEIR